MAERAARTQAQVSAIKAKILVLEAHFHDGVLAVRAPKAAATPRAVEVEPE